MAYEAYQAGKTKAEAKQYEEAIASFKKAIEVGDPDKAYDANIMSAAKKSMAAAVLNQGTALRNEKDYAAALEAYLNAYELAQESEAGKIADIAMKNGTRVAYVRGNELKSEEQYEAALEVYEQGISLDSTYYKNFLGQAQALEELDQFLKSMKAYMATGDLCLADEDEEVVEKGEKMYKKAVNMIAIASSEKEWDNTIEMATAYLEVREDADVHYYLGNALLEKGNADEALMHAEKAVELKSDDVDDTGKYLMLKGGAFEAQGKTAEAIESYKAVSGKYGESASYRIKELSN